MQEKSILKLRGLIGSKEAFHFTTLLQEAENVMKYRHLYPCHESSLVRK